MSYKDLYKLFQRLSYPTHGPIDIFGLCYWPLMIGWMCLVSTAFDWMYLAQRWGESLSVCAIVLARAIPLVQTPVRLQRAQRSVNACLRNMHLPTMRKITVKLTSWCLVRPASQCWRRLIDLSFLPTLVRGWLRQQVRFTHGSPKTFLSQCKASSLAKKVDWKSFWSHLPSEVIADRILMKSAVKINK